MPDQYIAVGRQSLIDLRDLLVQVTQSLDQILAGVPEELLSVRKPTAWHSIQSVLKEKRVPIRAYNALGQFFLKEENAGHPVYSLTYEQFVSEIFLTGGGRVRTIPHVGSKIIEDLRWAFS